MRSEIVTTEFYVPRIPASEGWTDTYIFVIVSDGEHRGMHRLLMYQYDFVINRDTSKIEPRSFQLLSDFQLKNGVPKAIAVDYNRNAIISEGIPYIKYLECDFDDEETGVCDPDWLSYLEIGFGAEDIAFQRFSFLVTKPDEDRIVAFQRP